LRSLLASGAEEVPRKSGQNLPENEVLHERAIRCRQLADGIGDLAFVIKLNALSDEYEAAARQTQIASAGTGNAERATITRR